MTPEERDEITASVAAQQELGPDYDNAVAEGLVERIGAEIDKRVDARVSAANTQAPLAPAARHARGAGFAMLLISLIFGTGATSVVIGSDQTDSAAQAIMVILIWAAIAAINIVYALRR